MRVFVVGASGFLGSAIARQLVAKGDQVWGAFRRSPDAVPQGCQTVSVDAMNDVPQVDAVVMAAGNHALAPPQQIEVNVHLPTKIQERFPEARLVYVSSVSVYGAHDQPIDETSTFNRPSFYGLAKLAGEAVVRSRPSFSIVRLTYLYGRDMPSNSFLPMIVAQAKREGRIKLFGRGERIQDYLHVEDAARLCLTALSLEGNQILLGATGRSVSNAGIALGLKRHLPDLQVEFGGSDSAISYRFDPSRSMLNSGWHPTRDVETDLLELL